MTTAPRLLFITLGAALIALLLASHPTQAQQPAPQAAFDLDIDLPLVPLVINPTNTSTGADTFRWDFGDDATPSTNETQRTNRDPEQS